MCTPLPTSARVTELRKMSKQDTCSMHGENKSTQTFGYTYTFGPCKRTLWRAGC